MVKKGAAALMAASRRASAAEFTLTNAHCKEKVKKVQNFHPCNWLKFKSFQETNSRVNLSFFQMMPIYF